MGNVYPILGVVPEREIDGMVDEQGFVTPRGRESLKRMGVETGPAVSIGKSTLRLLVDLHRGWRRPRPRIDPEAELIVGKFLGIPEEDIYLEERLGELRKSFRLGVRVGEGTRIGEGVALGPGVCIGRFCEVSDSCEICAFSTIRDKVYLGKSVFIGKDSEIGPGSRIMPGATVAPRNVVMEKAVIAEGGVFNENNKYR